ncbi:winged helix-turn-helix domain-containing tetratricopeptide repeat protein [Roseomonas rosulenta]|uniref:winged helix-turn-helix domain-containing tetratricopeptide repeat protein n=1 Tax=Roseomonas rosulenta TaxID=2748667 RepID=UPI0018DF530C|nr:winged helix-turn-helix domain-containing protein [Roseomonas rosulenta]
MSLTAAEISLGSAVLDPERGVIRCAAGAATILRPKTLEVLMLLLGHPGRLVSRADILDAVWRGVNVTDDSITQCIVELRRALGPDATLIRTVARRGYVLEAPPAVAQARPRAEPLPSGVPVVAVLPFRQVGADDGLATFAEGVLEGVVGALAALREPVVISSNSTLRLAEDDRDPRAVGARLGARYVAGGTVRRTGAQIRLTVELAEAGSAAVLWQRSFDVSGECSFEAQDRIAAIIANTLAPRVQEAELVHARRRPPADMKAYALMLEARQLVFRMDRDAFEQAGRMLRQAAALDPEFPAVHAAIADWHSLRVGQGWSADIAADTRAVEAAVDHALARDSSHPRALALLGHNHTILRRRYDDALALFDRALAAAPNDAETWMWTSPTFAWMGEGREALRRAERALALSPEDPLIFRYEHFASIAHYASENHEAAVEWGLRSMRSSPNYTSNLRVTAAALVALGRGGDAAPLARRVLALEPGFRVGPMIAKQAFRDDAARASYGQRLVEAGLPA